jgi:hypothetical protein
MSWKGKKGPLPDTNVFVKNRNDLLRHIYHNIYDYIPNATFKVYADIEDTMYNVHIDDDEISIIKIK